MLGDPTDDDVDQIRRTVIGLLQSFRYQGSQDSLSGLNKSEEKYRARLGHAFDRLKTADKYDYDPHMTSKPDIGERR